MGIGQQPLNLAKSQSKERRLPNRERGELIPLIENTSRIITRIYLYALCAAFTIDVRSLDAIRGYGRNGSVRKPVTVMMVSISRQI